MKKAFARISSEKRDKIIQVCIEEFGTWGYEKSSTDRIIKRAGISKGGLYEYISSKEELFLYIVEYSYTELYSYLRKRIQEEQAPLPKDILERIRLVSSMAIDFYLAHPRFIALITKTYQIAEQEISRRIHEYFAEQFLDIFGDTDELNLKFPKSRILELLTWLLLKTRQEFLEELEKEQDIKTIQKKYMDNWEFYITILKQGIYQ